MKYIKLFENFKNKTIFNVDIQPEYVSGIDDNFDKYEWAKWVNKMSKTNQIVFLFNGEDTLGMINQGDYIMWLINLGIKESVIDNATFYDKGYNFFRYCIDESIEEDNIVDLVKYMIRHDINDSRDIDWKEFMQEYSLESSEVRELLEFADDCLWIPDLMDFIKYWDNIVVCGGGINECLKEVEIALKALEKPYSVESKYTY